MIKLLHSKDNCCGEIALDTRKRLDEIINRKMRSKEAWSSHDDITRLKELLSDRQIAPRFIPLRIVTLLEVLSRLLVEEIVDFGEPYLERTAKLKLDLKVDFEVARNLSGRRFTLGQLVAHTVPLTNVESLASVFTELNAGSPIFASLLEVKDRWVVREKGDSAPAIISDSEGLKRDLITLYELRNRIAHENNFSDIRESDELERYIDSASLFAHALDEYWTQKLHGPDFFYTQREMTEDARKRATAAQNRLKEICDELFKTEIPRTEFYDAPTINAVQEVWNKFVDMEAGRIADCSRGGSIAPMEYWETVHGLTEIRIRQLVGDHAA